MASTKTRPLAIALAFSGVLLPGLHKFYLRQWGWGILYMVLLPTHVPQVASLIEGLWYGTLDQDEFDHNFNTSLKAHLQPPDTFSSHGSSPSRFTHRFKRSQQSSSSPTSGSSSHSVLKTPASQSFQPDVSFFKKTPQGSTTGANTEPKSPVWAILPDLKTTNSSPASAVDSDLIDVNRATLADWLQLPGLTLEQGRSLVALQAQGVQFHCLDDLAAALSLPVEQLRPIEARLAFYYYEPKGFNSDEVSPIGAVDPNRAPLGTLMRIPGINAAMALQIIHHRTPPYRNLADLQQRLGLGADQIEHLMHYLQF